MVFEVLFSLILGYLLGSVVTAILISKVFFKEDIRDKGSGNSGATNAARVYGLRFGIVTFALDFAKGIIACLIGRLICGHPGLAAAGIGCVIGHCFPVLFGFRGGKGVSVGAAFALMIDWRIFLFGIALFLLVAFAAKIVSAGSISGTLAVFITSLIFAPTLGLKLSGAAAAVIVIFMHRGNIARLLRGEEKHFTIGRR